MTLTLKRLDYLPDGIFSTLLDESGNEIAACLEHAYELGPVMGAYSPKLPKGRYVCKLGTHQLHSAKAPFKTFEITNVPGHTNILFHVGNFNNDSEGCVLLGEYKFKSNDVNQIAHSAATFDRFMKLLKDLTEFNLIVT